MRASCGGNGRNRSALTPSNEEMGASADRGRRAVKRQPGVAGERRLGGDVRVRAAGDPVSLPARDDSRWL